MGAAVHAFYYREINGRGIAGALLVLLCFGLVTGCGSTKVYSPDKTFEHKGSIYNVSDVKHISTSMEAKSALGETIDLQGYDGKTFEALLKEQGILTVRSVVILDDNVIIYQEQQVQKRRDFERMQGDLKGVYKDLTRFMADPRKTQLKL